MGSELTGPHLQNPSNHRSFFLFLNLLFGYLLQQLKDEIAEVTAEMESLDNTGEDRYCNFAFICSRTL